MNKTKRVAWHKRLKTAQKRKLKERGETAAASTPPARATSRAKHS